MVNGQMVMGGGSCSISNEFKCLFFNHGHFVLFSSFSYTVQIIIEKSIDVLGIQPRGRRIVAVAAAARVQMLIPDIVDIYLL